MKIEESIEIVQKEAEEIKNGKGLYYLYYDETLDDRKRTAEAIENLLTAYEKEKEENEQWKKYATNDLENQITERNNKILKLEAELEKEKEKNKNARYYIIDRLNNDDIINIGIDDMKIILDILEE